jgi:hypothetical protein
MMEAYELSRTQELLNRRDVDLSSPSQSCRHRNIWLLLLLLLLNHWCSSELLLLRSSCHARKPLRRSIPRLVRLSRRLSLQRRNVVLLLLLNGRRASEGLRLSTACLLSRVEVVGVVRHSGEGEERER